MAASKGNVFYVSDTIELYSVTKEPGEKKTVSFDCSPFLPSGVTISSAGSITVTPVDVPNAATCSAAALDGTSKVVSTTIDVGTTAWNTNGVGRAKFVLTLSNGDKREIDLEIRIVQL